MTSDKLKVWTEILLIGIWVEENLFKAILMCVLSTFNMCYVHKCCSILMAHFSSEVFFRMPFRTSSYENILLCIFYLVNGKCFQHCFRFHCIHYCSVHINILYTTNM